MEGDLDEDRSQQNIGARRGLCSQKHYEAMGDSVWLFLWCLAAQTRETENGCGLVFGGAPVTYEQIQRDFAQGFSNPVSIRTFQRWMARLTEMGYLSLDYRGTKESPHTGGQRGMIIRIFKAKKFRKRDTTEVSDVEAQDTTEVSDVGAQDTTEVSDVVKEEKENQGKENQGKSTNPSPFDPHLAFAVTTFRKLRGQDPFWTHRQIGELAALVERGMTVAEFSIRWENYLASTEPFTVSQGASLGYFCKNSDRFTAVVHPKNSPAQKERDSYDAINRVCAEVVEFSKSKLP